MYSMCSMIVHQGEVAWRHQWLPTRTRERQNSASVRGRMLHDHVEDGYACDVCKLALAAEAAATRTYAVPARRHARLRILASAPLSSVHRVRVTACNCKAGSLVIDVLVDRGICAGAHVCSVL